MQNSLRFLTQSGFLLWITIFNCANAQKQTGQNNQTKSTTNSPQILKLWQKENTVTSEKIERFTVGRDREMDLHLAEYDYWEIWHMLPCWKP